VNPFSALGKVGKGAIGLFSNDEEESKKKALADLTNRYLSGGSMMYVQPPEQEPNVLEKLGGIATDVAGEALTSEDDDKKKKEEPWYKSAARGFFSK